MDSLRMGKASHQKDKNTSKISSISERPATSTLTTEQRIHALANIIVDRILERQKQDAVVLSQ